MLKALQKAGMAGLFALATAFGCTPAQGGDTQASQPEAPAPTTADRAPTPATPTRPEPGRAWVIFGADTVVAEVAGTPEQRAEGLMYRQEVPDGTGMLFVFEDNEIRSFWMENTYVPLDIAFLDASFVVVDIQQMEPLTTDPHQSAAPAMFALEVRQGWFAQEGIQVGARPEVVFGLR